MGRYVNLATILAALFCLSLAAAEPLPPAPPDKPPALSKALLDYLAKPESDIDIGMGALLICKEEYPDLNIGANIDTLNQLGDKLFKALTQAGTVTAKLEALRTLLFRIEQYQLPEKDSAADFLLSGVLKNKRGNCLGLSVLCLALAERAGLKLFGVPVPSRLSGAGHLLVRFDDGTHRENFDPTQEGAAFPDDHYKDLFKLRPEDLKSGYILGNASRKDVLCILLVNLGGSRVEGDAPLTALPLLEQAIAMKPNYANAFNNLGAAKLRMSDVSGAVAAYNKALDLQPGLVGARLGLADIAIRRGAAETAEKQIEAVLVDEPGNLQAKCLQASLEASRGRLDAAIGLLREVVDALPNDVRAHCNLGKLYMLKGEFGAAERVYKDALTIEPNSADAHAGLGSVYRSIDKVKEGDAEFAAALKIDPNHAPTLLTLARIAVQSRKLDVAEEYCEKVLKRQPYDLEALQFLADVLLKERKAAEAIKRLSAFVKAHPENLAMAAALADAYIEAKQNADAIALLQPLADKAAEEERRPLIQRLAVCYGRQSDHRRALEMAEKLLKDKPDDLVALRIAASASEGMRNAPKAIDYYKQILKLAPDDAKAQQALARLGAK